MNIQVPGNVGAVLIQLLKVMHKDGSFTYNQATDSLEAAAEQRASNYESIIQPAAGGYDREVDSLKALQALIAARYVVPSNDELCRALCAGNNNSLTYVKEKEFKVGCISGAVRVEFEMHSTGTGDLAYGRVYVNDIAVGEEHTIQSQDYSTFVEDIPVVYGDLVQIWFKTNNASRPVYWRNARLYGSPEHYFRVDLDN